MKKLIALLVAASLMSATILLLGAKDTANPTPENAVSAEETDTRRTAEVRDAVHIFMHLAKMHLLPVEVYDFNSNGKIDVGDAVRVFMGLAKMIDKPEISVDIKPSKALWTEVPIGEPVKVDSIWEPFDLRSIIMGYDVYDDYTFNTYVFKGTVVGVKEFENSWIDGVGNKWGPYTRSVIEVKVNKEYHGKSPIEGDIIRVMYNDSLSLIEEGSVHVKEGGEYIFANNWVLDETFTIYNEKYNPITLNSGTTKYADIIIGGTRYSLLPIEDEKVMLYHEFFNHDNNAKSKVLPPDSVKADLLTSGSDSLKNGFFIAMNMSDFEEAFMRLFENPEKLPTAKVNLYDNQSKND